MRNECLQACAKCPFRSSCSCAKYYPGLWFLWIHSVVPNDSVSEQWRSWSYCADALADLGLRCPHMSEDTFSHGSAHLIVVNILLYKTVISDVFSHLGVNFEILVMQHTADKISNGVRNSLLLESWYQILLFKNRPFSEGSENILAGLSPYKVYQFKHVLLCNSSEVPIHIISA